MTLRCRSTTSSALSGKSTWCCRPNWPDSGNVAVIVKNAQGASVHVPAGDGAADVGLSASPIRPSPRATMAPCLFANTAWHVMPASMAAAIGFPTCANAPARFAASRAKAKDVIEVFVTGLGKATPNGDPDGLPLATGTLAPADGSIDLQNGGDARWEDRWTARLGELLRHRAGQRRSVSDQRRPFRTASR